MTQPATAAQHQAPHPDPVASSFLSSLADAQHETSPFDYWLLQNALPAQDVDDIANLPFAPPSSLEHEGRRATNNATRVYFTPENQEKFPVCARVAAGFKRPEVIETIERTTGTDLTDTHLRIEYCQDIEGFWLEPHTDIFVKKYTMLVYLSDDPRLRNAGTDIHEGPPDFRYVTSAPYGKNKGVIFIPGKTSWHAVGKRPFKGIRKSIIINFVTSDWRDKWELA